MQNSIPDQIKNTIKQVDIDPQGVFKYILIQFIADGNPYYFVRGFKQHEFHADNFDHFKNELKQSHIFDKVIFKQEEGFIYGHKADIKYEFKCLGGGRIEHQKDSLFVYGYSQSYGQADHQLAMNILNSHFKYGNDKLKISNEGY